MVNPGELDVESIRKLPLQGRRTIQAVVETVQQVQGLASSGCGTEEALEVADPIWAVKKELPQLDIVGLGVVVGHQITCLHA